MPAIVLSCIEPEPSSRFSAPSEAHFLVAYIIVGERLVGDDPVRDRPVRGLRVSNLPQRDHLVRVQLANSACSALSSLGSARGKDDL